MVMTAPDFTCIIAPASIFVFASDCTAISGDLMVILAASILMLLPPTFSSIDLFA